MTYRFGRGARSAHLLRRPSGVVASSGVVLPTTDLLVALFADQGVTDDGAGEVTAWADQDSTSGPHDVTQSDATERPEVDATGGPEGGQTIAFGAQSTDTNGHLTWSSALTAVASPHTYYLVCNPASTAGTQFAIDFNNTGGRESVVPARSGNVSMFDGTYRSFAAATTGWQCLTLQSATTVCRAFRARSQIGTDQTWAGDRALDISLGSGLGSDPAGTVPFNGRISAVLIYDRAHDAGERAAVWDYLADRYPSVGL